jgi:hypothetical protein
MHELPLNSKLYYIYIYFELFYLDFLHSKTFAIKIKCDPFELYHLQQQWKEWKANLQSFNLKIEFQLNNDLIHKTNETKGNDTYRNQSTYNLNDLIKIYLNEKNPVSLNYIVNY